VRHRSDKRNDGLLQIRGVDGVSPTVVDVVPDSPEVTGVLLNVVGITTDPVPRPHTSSLVPNSCRSRPDHFQRQPRRCDQGQLGIRAHRYRRQGAHLQQPARRRSSPTSSATCAAISLKQLERVGRSALVAVSHLRHPPSTVRWRCSGRARPRTGVSPTSPLRWRSVPTRVGAQLASRQPHLGGAHWQYPTAIARSFLTAYPATSS
jgi:hypothetical protein